MADQARETTIGELSACLNKRIDALKSLVLAIGRHYVPTIIDEVYGGGSDEGLEEIERLLNALEALNEKETAQEIGEETDGDDGQVVCEGDRSRGQAQSISTIEAQLKELEDALWIRGGM